ncbi:MAG: hypothetical protein KA248_02115 [Kiritimatiellae bacterium]|nr:hypothetical protein [Kiritimatiellia bacterium]
MPANLDRINQEAIRAAERGLLQTALTRFQQALDSTTNALERALAAYQLGAFHWGETGEGSAAREFFQQTIREWRQGLSMWAGGRPPPKTTVVANAAENLMLMSLSFDEFDQWSEVLRSEAPDEPILSELAPVFQQKREEGVPWGEVILHYAFAYVRSPGLGGGSHPSSGACIFRLLIENRKALRLSRQNWRIAILGYVEAMCSVLGRAEDLMRKAAGGYQPAELAFAHPFMVKCVEEYCAENPADKELAMAHDMVKKMMKRASAPPAAAAPSQAGPAIDPRAKPTPGHFATALVAMLLGLWPFVAHAALGWRIAGSVLITMGILSFLGLLALARQFGGGMPAGWQRNDVVAEGIASAGIRGLTLQLEGYKVGPMAYLYLDFVPGNPASQDGQERAVHMALRSIVALTLPVVVGGMAGYRLVNPGIQYTIGFGRGVAVPFYELHGPSGVLQTLQVGSEFEDGRYRICIHPSGGPVDAMFLAAMNNAGAELQRDLGEAFMSIRSRVITL